jgi:hypothetical protein
MGLGFELRASTCKAGPVLLEPQLLPTFKLYDKVMVACKLNRDYP